MMRSGIPKHIAKYNAGFEKYIIFSNYNYPYNGQKSHKKTDKQPYKEPTS